MANRFLTALAIWSCLCASIAVSSDDEISGRSPDGGYEFEAKSRLNSDEKVYDG